MVKRNKAYLFIGLFVTVLVLAWSTVKSEVTIPVAGPLDFLAGGFETEREEGYYTIQDEDGNVLQRTALPVYVGDEYIAENNKRYKVIRVEGDIAFARFTGMEKLSYNPEWDEPMVAAAATKQKSPKKMTLGVYHTHSDESYVPTDGKSSIYGHGGIFKVGTSYTKQLRKVGVNVKHSMRPHDPHDANAYHRSRRTAVELLKAGSTAIIDVHRDAVPPDVYASKYKGKPITKVKLVVGRRNPHMNANLQFAKDIKAYMDKHKPGVIEGIFLAKGNYNQDLTPKAMLIEVGSHTNSRYNAESGVDVFATAIPKVLGAKTGTSASPKATPKAEAETRTKTKPQGTFGVTSPADNGSWTSMFWIIGVVVVGVAAFLLISTGSVKGSFDKLRHFSSKELANAIGYKRARKKKKE